MAFLSVFTVPTSSCVFSATHLFYFYLSYTQQKKDEDEEDWTCYYTTAESSLRWELQLQNPILRFKSEWCLSCFDIDILYYEHSVLLLQVMGHLSPRKAECLFVGQYKKQIQEDLLVMEIEVYWILHRKSQAWLNCNYFVSTSKHCELCD